MQALWTEHGERAIAEIASRHGFGEDAGRAMAEALAASAGSMAQFHHPDFGGMGQWSRGGMLMIGDMFNNGLKARVGALADELADAMGRGAIEARRPAPGASTAGFGRWWPDELGEPTSTGAQNGRRYAVFPHSRRVAIETDDRVRIYDTGDDRIGGASQQQGGGSSLSFATDRGSIGVEQYREVGAAPAARPATSPATPVGAEPLRQAEGATESISRDVEPASSAPTPQPATEARPATPRIDSSDPIELIRKLATLKEIGALTDEEFQAKKTELLARI